MIYDGKPELVIWQTSGESAPEPAITLKWYSDVIQLRQEGRYIIINSETVPDLVRALKRLQPELKKSPVKHPVTPRNELR